MTKKNTAEVVASPAIESVETVETVEPVIEPVVEPQTVQAETVTPEQTFQVKGQQPGGVQQAVFNPVPVTSVSPTEDKGVVTEDKTEVDEPIVDQEAFNRALAKRLEAERKKFADYDALKAKVAEFEGGQKTSEEKIAERLAALEKQNADLLAAQKKAVTQRSISAAAGAVGLTPELAEKLIDMEQAKLDDDGTVQNAEDLVKVVIEKYPGLVAKKAPVLPASNPSKSPDDPAEWMKTMRYGGSNTGFWTGGGNVVQTGE